MKPLEDDEVALEGEIMQTVSIQVNDAFLGSGSFQGGKTRTYLEEYCTPETMRNSVDISKSCMDLVFIYAKTYRVVVNFDKQLWKMLIVLTITLLPH